MNLKLETNSNKAKSFDEEILNSFIKQHLYLYSEKIILRWSSNELIFVHVCWNRSLEINWTVKHFRRITMNDVHWALNLFIYIQNAILNENANQSSEKQNEKKRERVRESMWRKRKIVNFIQICGYFFSIHGLSIGNQYPWTMKRALHRFTYVNSIPACNFCL